MKNLLNKVNIFTSAFSLLVIKGLVLTFDWQTVTILVALLAFKVVETVISSKKPIDQTQDVLNRLKSIETKLALSNISKR